MNANAPSVWMQDLTWEEVKAYLDRDQIAIVPVGSTEQHGPAGVLGVDSYVAITLAEDIVGRLCELVEWLREYKGPIGRRDQAG